MEKFQKLFYIVVNSLLFAAGLIALLAGAYSTWLLQAATATAFFAASLVLLFASTIDRFETLKGFGIEAKQRELTKTLSEVNAVLNEVQRLNYFTSKSLATLYAKSGRANGPPKAAEIYSVISEFRTTMNRAQASELMIREALSPCVYVMLADLKFAAVLPATRVLDLKVAELSNQAMMLPTSDPTGERQSLLAAANATRNARTEILNTKDYSEQNFPGKLISTLRSKPASEFAESETAASLLSKFAADIQSLQRRGTIDDPAAWFSLVDEYLEQ